LILLLVVCFSLATYLQPRQAARDAAEGQSAEILAVLLGDGRKMFANQFYAKADAYFHRGNYPSIFDHEARREENHMQGEAGHRDHEDSEEHHEEEPPERKPLDWIERFGRNFYPTKHVHLEGGEEREMLPWLQLSAEMDPHQTQFYTVAAYWLRDRLGKVDEAERFLREGLRKNPNAPDLLDELARLNFENRKDLSRARNLWLAALREWRQTEPKKKEPNLDLLEKILGGLERIEVQNGRLDQAIEYLKQMKEISPNPDALQKQIDEMTAKLRAAPAQ